MPLLIPGIGAQGGDVAATVAAGQDSRGWGMIINSSRGIIYASRGDDFAQAAYLATVRLRDEVNACREGGEYVGSNMCETSAWAESSVVLLRLAQEQE